MDDPLLEPDWGTIVDGNMIDLMLHLVVWGGPDPEAKHLCKTAIRNKFVVVYGKLTQHPSHSVLGGIFTGDCNGIRISTDSAVILPHGVHGPSDFCNVIEGCTGIGCLGSGLESCGFSLIAGNDLSPPMCQFLESQGRCNIVQGDIGSASVLQRLHSVNQPPACLAGGFSCQPWSALGDRRKCHDPRAASLKHLLKAGFHLRVHSIMLECVTGAAEDVQVCQVIDRFCSDTGFKKVDVCLHLQDIMPARRDRWWCILTCPAISVPDICGLPKLPTAPVVGDLLPYNIAWPVEQQEQLLLDRYETGKFECYGGLCSQLVRPGECLKTALHGWGNQLHGCPCLCRAHALSESRLKERGLFGALFMVGGEFQTSQWVLAKTRHVHPIELALLHGVPCDWEWGPSLKFSLYGLGQQASPVQSCWVGGHLMKGIDLMMERPWTSPAVHLANHFVRFFASVKKVLPMVAAHDKFYSYTRDVWALLRAHAQEDAGIPLPVLPPDDPVVIEKNIENSQRSGRKNLEVQQEKTKQPATRSPEPEKRNNQPACGTPEPDKQPAAETQGLHSSFTMSPPFDVHAMPRESPVLSGPSRVEPLLQTCQLTPSDQAVQSHFKSDESVATTGHRLPMTPPSHDPVHAMPLGPSHVLFTDGLSMMGSPQVTDQVGDVPDHAARSRSVGSDCPDTLLAGPAGLGKIGSGMPCSLQFQALPQHGGIPAFVSPRVNQPSGSPVPVVAPVPREAIEVEAEATGITEALEDPTFPHTGNCPGPA